MENGDIFGFIFKPNATPHIEEQIWPNIKNQVYLIIRQKRLKQKIYPFDWGWIIFSQFVKLEFYSKAFVQVEQVSEYFANVMNVLFKTWNLKPIPNRMRRRVARKGCINSKMLRFRSDLPFFSKISGDSSS